MRKEKCRYFKDKIFSLKVEMFQWEKSSIIHQSNCILVASCFFIVYNLDYFPVRNFDGEEKQCMTRDYSP